MGKMLDSSGRNCIDDVKPFLMLIQKTSIFGVSMEFANETSPVTGMIPVAGLYNAYDAACDPKTGEVWYCYLKKIFSRLKGVQ